MRLLVLGGTSIAGQAVLQYATEYQTDCRIYTASRSHDFVPNAQRVIRGHFTELLKTGPFRQDLSGYDAVVHLADGAPILQQARHVTDTTLADQLVSATRELLVAAQDAGVPKFGGDGVRVFTAKTKSCWVVMTVAHRRD
jgi:nucleoside-diphosphate-sugar epimerase